MSLVSELNPLHLIEADVVPAPVVELGRARRGVVGHRGCVLQCPAVLEISRDAGCPEGVVAYRGLDARHHGPSSHHGVRIGLGKCVVAQLPGAAPDRAKQRPFRVVVDPCLGQVGMQILFQSVVTGHLMPLAPLFM